MAQRIAKTPLAKRPWHDESEPEVLQAAHIAFGVMHGVQANNWAGVVEVATRDGDIRDKVVLTANQQRLIDENAAILPHLQIKPPVTVAVCSDCGMWAVVASASSSKKCTLTLHCPGKSEKAATAKRWQSKDKTVR